VDETERGLRGQNGKGTKWPGKKRQGDETTIKLGSYPNAGKRYVYELIIFFVDLLLWSYIDKLTRKTDQVVTKIIGIIGTFCVGVVYSGEYDVWV
jgi:hypothetical protein